jgi:hypothetical protein
MERVIVQHNTMTVEIHAVVTQVTLPQPTPHFNLLFH